MAKLTTKQSLFIDEYMIDLNAKQAAIRAGYSTKSAAEIASTLLTNINVQPVLDARMAERSRRTGVNQDRIINELAKIAFLNITDVVNLDEAMIRDDSTREDSSCIASVKVKVIPTEDGNITEREIKTYDKIKALELLGKHNGMFTDRVKVEGAIPVVIGGADELED